MVTLGWLTADTIHHDPQLSTGYVPDEESVAVCVRFALAGRRRPASAPFGCRKKRLNDLTQSGDGCRILYAQHIEAAGKEFFNEICRCDLEGIVAKREMGAYREDRPDWLKIKNRTYSQAEGSHELLTRKTGRRS